MDWQLIVGSALVLALLVLGGYLKKLIRETKEFFGVLSAALEDDNITDKELVEILREGVDVRRAIADIIQLFFKAR